MDFGYKLKKIDGKLKISFKKKPIVWRRLASQLVKDRVIVDIENAKKLIGKRGDFVVYEVFNIWKFVNVVKTISERIKVSSNITLLKHGIFSLENYGELFSTYGHAHREYYGEFYTILKNQCFVVLTNKKSNDTFIVNLKEGDSIFIHPKFLHRVVSYKKDVLMLDTSPRKTGHDYKIIKNRGFPFHVFYNSKNDKIEFVKNKRYKKGKLKFIKKIKSKVSPIKLFEKNPEKLKDILENPNKHKKIYFKGNQS